MYTIFRCIIKQLSYEDTTL